MSSRISLRSVHRRYQRGPETVHALTDVSFELAAGTIVGLIGPSGSGKTTLLHLIIGWDHPTEGTVERDASVADDWSGLAVVPQGLGLLPELTLAENVELPGRLGNAAAVTTKALFTSLGLDGLADRRSDEASLGEQQRVAVARAVVGGPAVLIADEPTAHQDEVNAARVVERLVATARAGSAVLVATHDDRLLPAVDLVLRLEDGHLVVP
jgi:ABC-type lipoprotein export system ATPase subunit